MTASSLQKRATQASAVPCAANDSNIDDFLTPEDASKFLGSINARTLTRWARQGMIPAYPLGEGKRRLWRFRRADLHQWMLSRQSGPNPLAFNMDERTLVKATDAPDRRMIQ